LELRKDLIQILSARFKANADRHAGIEWSNVHARLEANPEKLRALYEMERTGGEPDIVGYDKETANTSSMIALLKLLPVAETFATTMRH
jgi:hypothetical protein